MFIYLLYRGWSNCLLCVGTQNGVCVSSSMVECVYLCFLVCSSGFLRFVSYLLNIDSCVIFSVGPRVSVLDALVCV
jgi:hypothetical protein